MRANVIIDDKGYPAIDDGKGKGWLEPKSKPVKSEKKSEPETKESGDENIPFNFLSVDRPSYVVIVLTP